MERAWFYLIILVAIIIAILCEPLYVKRFKNRQK